MAPSIINKSGMRFGRLLVLRCVDKSTIATKTQNGAYFECLCDCGNRSVVHSSNLGRTTFSCGCLRRLLVSANQTKHGMEKSVEYRTWVAMRSRCRNPRDKSYRYYGGRGIGVCKRWQMSFQSFYDDMGPRPSGRYSLERIDNEKGYRHDNCKWILLVEQSKNRRTCKSYRHSVTCSATT